MGTRGVDASAHHSLGIRSGSHQTMRHARDGCCGVIWRLCSAGLPCRNLFLTGAIGAGFIYSCPGSYAVLAALSSGVFEVREHTAFGQLRNLFVLVLFIAVRALIFKGFLKVAKPGERLGIIITHRSESRFRYAEFANRRPFGTGKLW